jgi:hypothetical protein
MRGLWDGSVRMLQLCGGCYDSEEDGVIQLVGSSSWGCGGSLEDGVTQNRECSGSVSLGCGDSERMWYLSWGCDGTEEDVVAQLLGIWWLSSDVVA